MKKVNLILEISIRKQKVNLDLLKKHPSKPSNPTYTHSTPSKKPWDQGFILLSFTSKKSLQTPTPLKYHGNSTSLSQISVFNPNPHPSSKSPPNPPNHVKEVAYFSFSEFFALPVALIKPPLSSTYHRNSERGHAFSSSSKKTHSHFPLTYLAILYYIK